MSSEPPWLKDGAEAPLHEERALSGKKEGSVFCLGSRFLTCLHWMLVLVCLGALVCVCGWLAGSKGRWQSVCGSLLTFPTSSQFGE